MVKLERRNGPVGLLMIVTSLGLGGCMHQAHWTERHTTHRSLKDHPPTATKPVPAAAAVAPANIAPASGPRVLPPLRQTTATPAMPQKLDATPEKPLAPAEASATPPAVAPATAPPSTVTVAPRPSLPPSAAPIAPRPPAAAPQVLPSPPEPPLPTVLDAAGVERLLSEGQRLFNQGRVLDARRRFIAAMNGPVPEVLLALARSYDTYYLSRLPTADAAPDMQRALVLYERAVERGAIEANADLERTRNILKVPR